MSSVFKGVKQLLGLEEEDNVEEVKTEEVEIEEENKEVVVEEEISIPSSEGFKSDVYENPENKGDYQTVFVNPEKFEECKKIANYINEGKIVTLNLEGLSKEMAQRMIDFLAGAMEVKKARFVPVSKNVYVSVPNGVKSIRR